MSLKERAHLVFKHRSLFVTRREDLSNPERDDLAEMLEYLAESATLLQVRRAVLPEVRDAGGPSPGGLPTGLGRA